jgi:hypothetical protein
MTKHTLSIISPSGVRGSETKIEARTTAGRIPKLAIFQKACGLAISLAAVLPGSSANAQSIITFADRNPFSNLAKIPADADLGSIQFRAAKHVSVPTKVRLVQNQSYCEELAFRERGGSMYCPYIQTEAAAPAYEVTYSYTASPLSSDEYGGRYFTFSVLLRPKELTAAARDAVSRGKISRAEAERFFDVTASRTPERRDLIDMANSKFCDGNYADGAWVQTDSRCRDDVKYRTVMADPDYVTVRVDPASGRQASR